MADDEKKESTQTCDDVQGYIDKIHRLSSCIEIANLINAELSLGKLLSKIMMLTKKALKADAVSILLVDDDTQDLTFHVTLGDKKDRIKKRYTLKKGQGIAGLVAQTGKAMNIDDVYQHKNFSPELDQKTHYKTRAMLCAPLKIRGVVIGVIRVMNKLISPYVFSKDELEMLVTISNSAAIAIDTAKMHAMILQEETLERDLKLAREVQKSFLPKKMPTAKNYRFAALNQPALGIGGDFYNFFKLPGGKLGIVIGDVSGKGISASLFMARLTSDLQYYTLIYPDPRELLVHMNQLLYSRSSNGMFVTMVYMLLDTRKHLLKIANAGHASPIYISDNGIQPLCDDDKKGHPLGIMKDLTYHEQSFELTLNSSIVTYTDGVIEARNYQGELFGFDRVISAIEGTPNDPDLLVKRIRDHVDNFIIAKGLSDDITLLAFSQISFERKSPVRLSIRSHPENLKKIRKVLEKTLLEAGVEAQEQDNIILAVVEACSNIIRHSYQDDYSRPIDMTFGIKGGRLTITILERGLPFDTDAFTPRDVTQVKPGGLGVHIIQQVMDEVTYAQTSKGSNRIKMVKILKK